MCTLRIHEPIASAIIRWRCSFNIRCSLEGEFSDRTCSHFILELTRSIRHADPFVEHGVVESEIFEITPRKTDERLKFLLD